MNKTAGIITIYDNNNYGNRLQNYATQEILKKLRIQPTTIKNEAIINKKEKNNYMYRLRQIKKIYVNLKKKIKMNKERNSKFQEFNENIIITKNF